MTCSLLVSVHWERKRGGGTGTQVIRGSKSLLTQPNNTLRLCHHVTISFIMHLSMSSITFLFTSTLLPSSKLTLLSSSPSSYPFTHSSAPTIPLILSRSRHLSWSNSSHSNTKCLTSSTFPPLHSTHLSSSTIPHLFLSSNNPADPDLNRNFNRTAACPSHEPTYFSGPYSSLTFLYHFKLLFLSTSSCQSSQFCFSIFLFQAAADPDSSSLASSKPYFLSNISYSSLQPTPPDSY